MTAPRSLLSLTEAAQFIGLAGRNPGRRLREYCQRKEAREGRRILIRDGTTKRRRYWVTLGRLRRSCPELFDAPAEAERTVKRYLREHQGEHERLDRRVDDVEQRQAGVEQAVAKGLRAVLPG